MAAAFSAAQLAFVVPHGGLGWDEVVYVSQVSGHGSAAWFDPARARGVPLLVAPVAFVTSSVLALRVYLALASGLALFGALMVWRRLRPAWVLALAGLMLSSLWVVQFYGPRAMPDLWLALSGVAAAGFFLRAAGASPPAGHAARPGAGAPDGEMAAGAPPAGSDGGHGAPAERPAEAAAGLAASPAAAGAGPGRRGAAGAGLTSGARGALAGLAACLAVAALMRPGDAVFLAAPLLAGTALIPAWRRWRLAASIVAGLVAGGLEWVIEAYARFGGIFPRLHAAAAEQGGFGLHLGALAQWRGLNGPVQCRPCTAPPHYPELTLWWFALPLLVAAGIVAARRSGRLGSAVLATVCGLSVGFQYLVLISYGNPRFLIPTYALLALPAADGAAWLLTGTPAAWRPLLQAAAAAAIVLQIASQQVVLSHNVTSVNHFGRIAADLRRLGVRPPCLVRGKLNIPVAYYAGCESAPTLAAAGPGVRVVVIGAADAPPPSDAATWRPHHLAHVPGLVAYLPTQS